MDRWMKTGIKFAVVVLLCSLPFKHNNALVYISEGLLAFFFVLDLCGRKKYRDIATLFRYNPLTWIIAVYSATVLLSVFFSHDPVYSGKQFMYEICINVSLFYILCHFLQREYIDTTFCVKVLIAGNMVFIGAFFLQGVQWHFFPDHPLMRTIHTPLNSEPLSHIYFSLTRCSDLYSYKPFTICTLFYLALALSFFYSQVIPREKILMIALGAINMVLVIFSMEKAPIVAIVFATLLTVLLPLGKGQKIKVLVAIGITMGLSIIVFFGPMKSRFFKGENLSSLINGKFSKSGSTGLRVHGYEIYLKYVLKHPLKGVGIGRRNIKKGLPELVKKTGLSHGHNSFLNTALQQGIQSTLALIIFILVKFKHGISSLVKYDKYHERRYIFLVCYLIWLFMYWTRSSFDDMFRHDFSTFYWVLTSIFVYCLKIGELRENGR